MKSVSGIVRYEDKLYGPNGFISASGAQKPVRFADVDVVDQATGAIIAAGSTDSSGAYFMWFKNTGTSPVYLRVSAKTVDTIAQPLEVLDLYSRIQSATAVIDGPTLDILIPASGPSGVVGEAFNILDVITAAGEFIYSIDPLAVHPPLRVFWEAGSTQGTYYMPGSGLFILGNYNQDTDGYDDDVIWHEYGHFVADTSSLLVTPYTQHILGDNTQDLRLSWSEGWADYFPLAVKVWLAKNNGATLSSQGIPYSMYVDTALIDTEALNWSFDFGNPPGGTASMYSSNEAAVANILWNINGSPFFGANPLWAVFKSFKTGFFVGQMNLEAFWDRWMATVAMGQAEQAAVRTIFANRGVFYIEDAWESDDDTGSATAMTVPSAQSHYLFKENGMPDRDIASFMVTPADVLSNRVFSIFTSNLANGADTYITLYDGGFLQVAGKENDNYPPLNVSMPPNDGTTLASFLTFTASVAGTYYIEVTSSPNAPASAGRYGTYTLSIQ